MKNYVNLDFFKSNKKLIIKVAAGILLLVVAFFVYLDKADEKQNEVIILENPIAKEAVSPAALGEQAEEPLIIDVSGAVKTPGIVKLDKGGRVYEAVELAGGLLEKADTYQVNLAAVLSDGDKIFIPERDGSENRPAVGIITDVTGENGAVAGGKINLNTATLEQLQSLTGVGPSTASKIVSYRDANGGFKTVEELMEVSGIGEKTFEKLKENITV